MHYPGHPKSGLPKQVSVFRGVAFAAICVQQHLQVTPLTREVAVVLGEHRLHQQHRRIGAGGYADVTEDRNGLLIGPVVDDVFEDIGVAAGRNAVEERPALDADPVFDSP